MSLFPPLIPSPPTVPTLIAQAFMKGIIVKTNLDQSQVFVSIIPALDEGWQGDIQVQISPGDTIPEGGGHGSQDGGALLRRQSFKITIYYKLNLDPHGLSQALLIAPAQPMLDFIENIRNIFQLTNLGGLTYETLRLENETAPVWEDIEKSIATASITYSGAYGYDLPNATTLTAADLASVQINY